MGLFGTGLVGKLVEWIKNKLSSERSEFVEELEDGSKVKVQKGGNVELVSPQYRSSVARELRRNHYGDSGDVRKKAVKNHQVFSDVLDDPSLVGAGSEVEAVAEVAVANPGWASFVDFEADLGVDPGEVDAVADGDVHAGESKHGSTGDAAPDYNGRYFPTGVSSEAEASL